MKTADFGEPKEEIMAKPIQAKYEKKKSMEEMKRNATYPLITDDDPKVFLYQTSTPYPFILYFLKADKEGEIFSPFQQIGFGRASIDDPFFKELLLLLQMPSEAAL